MNRVIWIVLDSVGMGALPDAKDFGDEGANTIGHICAAEGGVHMPHMCQMGYGNIDGMIGMQPIDEPIGVYARAMEQSKGKDTTIGHWEMSGIYTPQAFPTYPNGFPEEIMQEFLKQTGLKGYLGNKVASGTAVIDELGEEHLKTGFPIIYTSADSVFQIAAHEEVISVERLYEICEIARKILTGKHNVARVIARPFEGNKGDFKRTARRRDFSRLPDCNNVLCHLKEASYEVKAVGKISDIFAGQGVTEGKHTTSNHNGMEVTVDYMNNTSEGLIYTNLVEFDMDFGHRRDAKGYKKALEEFDQDLPMVLSHMKEEDLLIITADHGCDPTYKGTDHTREYVPVICYSKQMKRGINMGTRQTFADIAATINEIFDLKPLDFGNSFLDEINKACK